MASDLPNKPLAEALLEIKWVPLEISFPTQADAQFQLWSDKGYPLFLGVLHAELKAKFPTFEELPAKQIPDELSPGIVKARFRDGSDGWPLVQAGPGVLSVNFTRSYTWASFQPTAMEVYRSFLSAYSQAADSAPRPTSVTLRYINAIETPEALVDTPAFLHDKLHVDMALPDVLKSAAGVDGPVKEVDLQLVVPLNLPTGTGHLRIANGATEGRPAVIFDLSVVSRGEDAPAQEADLASWLEQAHTLIETWFFSFIEGQLEEQFRGGD